MKGSKRLVAYVLLSAVCMTGLASAKTAGELLQEGLYAEEIEGNLESAIRLYGQVLDDPSAPKAQAAQALYRQGLCYMKMEDEARARSVFARLVADYSDQTRIIRDVKPMLEDLSNSDPASLMPADTLLYVELGSLGRQIEVISKMLSGTPFENPLALLGNGGEASSADSPGNILASLLNPSMLAEFKKIRGLGIGITDLPQGENGEPAIVGVLYPGKSDALRGIIMMGLSMVAKPGETIEGMKTLVFPGGAGAVAYDDTAIIVASPDAYKAGRLTWSVKQHRAVIHEPTLASNNASFARVGKQSRQLNAVTYWMNVDEAFGHLSALFADDGMPDEIRMANGLLDFRHIDDLIGSVTLKEDGKTVGLDVTLKEGHQCMAYQLARTPHLNRGALQGVPSQAIALATFALAEPGGAQAQAVSQKLREATGADIGAEIYRTIDQISLFVLPATDRSGAADSPLPPIADCVGVSLTGRGSGGTGRLLATLLTLAELIDDSSQAAVAEEAQGAYEVQLENGLRLYGYADEASRTTLLSVSPRVREVARNALSSRQSVSTTGPLSATIKGLPADTSKLLLVNIGGAARLAAQVDPFGSEETQQVFSRFAEVSERTELRIHTQESENHLAIETDLSGFGPVAEMFTILAPLFNALNAMDGGGNWSEPRDMGQHALVSAAMTPPQIDGVVDDIWSKAESHWLTKRYYEEPDGPADCSAAYRALYDKDNLYVLVEVTDEDLRNDSDDYYEDDSVEIFIDADNAKAGGYGNNDYQYYVAWDRRSPSLGESSKGNTAGVQYALVSHDEGYRVEIRFPWSTLGVKGLAGSAIGLDVQVSDDDGGGGRDSKLAWSAPEDNAWQVPAVFGTAHLAGLVGHWPLDNTVEDSSGHEHHGTIHGDPKWASGRVGAALDLDGKGDFVKIEHESAFDLGDSLTVAAWANIRSINGDWMTAVSKGDSAWRISTEYSQPIYHFGVSANTWLTGRKRVTMNTWHHVLCVNDGQQIRTYVDGRLDATTGSEGASGSNDYPVCIGENAQMEGRYWNGLIDDVRIYNYALSEHEIEALYQEAQ